MKLSLKNVLTTLAFAVLGLVATRPAAAQAINAPPGPNHSVSDLGTPATGLALLQSSSIVPSVRADGCRNEHEKPRYLYIWAGDQARTAPDFVSVIGFDEDSKDYGRVLKTVPVPTSGNEAHHMHLSADGNTLGCGGLLILLRGQDGIFFFDVSTPDN